MYKGSYYYERYRTTYLCLWCNLFSLLKFSPRVSCGLRHTFKVSFWSSRTYEIREKTTKVLSCRCTIGTNIPFVVGPKLLGNILIFAYGNRNVYIVLIFFLMSMLQAPRILCIEKALSNIQWPLKILSYNELGKRYCISHLFALLFGINGFKKLPWKFHFPPFILVLENLPHVMISIIYYSCMLNGAAIISIKGHITSFTPFVYHLENDNVYCSMM